MTQRELQIHRRTRDRGFLLTGALAIGAAFTLVGLAAGLWRGPALDFRLVPGTGTGELSVEGVTVRRPDLGGLAETIRDLAASDEGALDARRQLADRAIVAAGLPTAEAERLTLLADGLLGDAAAQERAIEALRTAAALDPPRRFDHEWLADVLSRRQGFEQAGAGYEFEGRVFPEAERARNRAFELALHRNDAVRLRRLLEDPAMIADVAPSELAQAHARCGNYGAVLAVVLRAQTHRFSSWLHTSIALLCGALWWLIFARIAGVPPRRWWLALPALVLGVFATTLTLVGQIVLPIPFDENGDLLQRALFFTVGVGLREETFKLLCAVPLIAYLRRESSPNLVLLALSTVGLGFAIEENTGYFDAGPSPAWGRFLTANFLHLAWTGMLGYSLWRVCRRAAGGWEQLFATFLLAVLSHGAYDLCFGEVLGENLDILSILIFVAVAFRFFSQLRSVAELSRQVVSPLAVFIFGSALMLGLTFAGLCWALGLRWGPPLFLGDALAIAPMAFLFIREFRDD